MFKPIIATILALTFINSVLGAFRKSKESVPSRVNGDIATGQQQGAIITDGNNFGGQLQQRGNDGVAAQPPIHFRPPPHFDGVPFGFEKVLPENVLEKMRELHRNQSIPVQQKQIEFDRIMSSVPGNILAKLPLPLGFESLPESIQAEVRNIHGNTNLNWTQKAQKVHQLVQSLPPNEQPRPPPGFPIPPTGPPHHHNGDFFPPNPPPGFEKVIPPQTYKQLLAIHRNITLSPQEKGLRIDQIMRSLPQDIIDQLPLPPGFEQLPEKELKKVKAIFGDRSLSFQEKDRKVFEFVKSLPLSLRRLVRPPLPPAFERLGPETKDRIVNLLDDDSLGEQQRQKRFWELVGGLSDDEKAIVQEALKFPA